MTGSARDEQTDPSNDEGKRPDETGEPATPQEAHDATAANVRRLRHGDDDPGRPD